MKVNRTLLPRWTNGLGAIVLWFVWLETSKAFTQTDTFKISDAALTGTAPGGARLLTSRNDFNIQRIPDRACAAEAASSPRRREAARPTLGARGESALSFLLPDGIRLWAATGVGVLLGLIAWRFRNRSSRRSAPHSLSAGSSATVSQTAYVDRAPDAGTEGVPPSISPTETASSETAFWQQRALAAESRAERALAVARAGWTPHLARMIKDRVVWTLMAQRTHMVTTQEASAAMVAELEERLERIQSEFESRVERYENRIAELERQLQTESQINRELLGATIDMAKKAMQDVAVRQPGSPFAAKYLTPRPTDDGNASLAGQGKLSFGDIMARRVWEESS